MRPLDHQIYKDLRQELTVSDHVVVACSGGVDSMVLLDIFKTIQPLIGIELSVVYVHHGSSNSVDSNKFRDSAYQLVEKTCKESSLKFSSNSSENIWPDRMLKSEEELRSFRFKVLRSTQLKQQQDRAKGRVYLATGHHADDFLETQLIKLIRGAGALGMLTFKQVDSERILRPLIHVDKETIVQEAKVRTLDYINDPSNNDDQYLRNWLRESWLPQLEDYRTGSVSQLRDSLFSVQESLKDHFNAGEYIDEKGIDLRALNELSFSQQQQVLAYYMNKMQLKSYTKGHIKEVLKRLDTERRVFSFKTIGVEWHCNSSYLYIGSQMSS